MLVTSSRGTPTAAQRAASSEADVCEDSVQPLVATKPSRTSTATTSASPKRSTASSRNLGSSVAVPIITRLAPARDGAADRLERPIAAADLDRELGRLDEALEQPARRSAVERATEVDDVQTQGAVLLVSPGKGDGIATFERHGLPASLEKPDDPALEHVDRRNHVELLC